MWLATEDGLNRYDGNTFVVYNNNPDDPSTLSANSIQNVIEDDHGFLWIGTWGGGLNKFDPTTERFTRYRFDPDNPSSISGDVIKSIAQDSRGYLWVGTQDSGLNRFDPAAGTFTRYRNDSNGQFVGAVNSILEDSHREIWFAGAGGLFKVNSQTGKITRPPAASNSFAADHLHEDKAGNLWMLTFFPATRLVKYDRQAGRFTEFSLGEGAVAVANSTILDDGQNGLWVASSQGLYHFDLQTEQFTYRFQHDETNPDSLNDNSVVSIYRDRAGVLWVGTDNGGLNLFNFRQAQFGSYRHRPGNVGSLSPGVVTAMHQDKNGILWVGYFPRALDRFDRKTGKSPIMCRDQETGTRLAKALILKAFTESPTVISGWVAGAAASTGSMNEADSSSITNISQMIPIACFPTTFNASMKIEAASYGWGRPTASAVSIQ